MSKKKFLVFLIIILLIVGGLIESNIINKIIYPIKYEEYVDEYSEEFDIDKYLVYSIIKAESKFKADAISHKEAKGLMQISNITRDWAVEELGLGKVDVFDPETNIRIGCWYLRKLYDQFGDRNLVIAAYNGGSGNVSKWLVNKEYSKDGRELNNIPFIETSNYVKKVNKNYDKYRQIYSKEGKVDEEI